MTAIVNRRPVARFRALDPLDVTRIPQLRALSEPTRAAMSRVARVLPFRVNRYIVDELIDWSNVPDDPIFQLTFPQPGMLELADHSRLAQIEATNGNGDEMQAAIRGILHRLNPHPADQCKNVPRLHGRALPGIQHKYRETVLFFPTQGQTCHAYCSYCFRWPQFVGLDDLKFASREVQDLVDYLRAHPEVTSVLITGGDPMIMRATLLERYIAPLLEIPTLTTIRIGSKSVAYWPQRYVTDDDADDVLRLFERVSAAGKSLALMAHYSHPRELSTTISNTALARIRATGATVRCQAPVIRHVNDDAKVWAKLWRTEVALGAVPYYMFVARDTGAQRYFQLPLARAWRIYREAISMVSGLARTVRGPSMSTSPGKVVIDGVTSVAGQQVFALRLLQGRDPSWVGRPFFAEYDERATWFDDLRPAFGESAFFFEPELKRMLHEPLRVLSGAA